MGCGGRRLGKVVIPLSWLPQISTEVLLDRKLRPFSVDCDTSAMHPALPSCGVEDRKCASVC